MGYRATADHRPSLSEKQQAVLLKIGAKIGFGSDAPPIPPEDTIDVTGYPIGYFDGLPVTEAETRASDADYEE